MRIGELAEAVGVTARTVRHYHRVGVLPEPPRRVNGYRVYGVRDVLRLARIRRLVELGLSLDEAADVLADDDARELPEILAELDADLARQEAEIRARRDRLAVLLQRVEQGADLDADDAVSPATAAVRDRLATAFPDSATARHDREILALFDHAGRADEIAALHRAALDDPERVARAAAFYRRFDELVDAAADDPRVAALARDLARDLAAALPPELAAQAVGVPAVDDHPVGAAILRELPPAQAGVVRAAHRLLATPSSPERSGERAARPGRPAAGSR
jgi:DNA-binding transcriptional MerR regulator